MFTVVAPKKVVESIIMGVAFGISIFEHGGCNEISIFSVSLSILVAMNGVATSSSSVLLLLLATSLSVTTS